MIRSAVTVSLVEAARGGPFVFWHDLSGACRAARELGFDAIELFAPGPTAVAQHELRTLLAEHQLALAAVGTGAGWVRHKLHLTHPDRAIRVQAADFIRSMIDFGGPLGAPAIIGSMQGRHGEGVDRDTALAYLAEGLEALGAHAAQYNVPLIYEPLNRYETNLCNTVEQGTALLDRLTTQNVVLLADLFHMNIEEQDIGTALQAGGKRIGHLHFVDSNRRAAGWGHLDYAPVVAALRAIGYNGYISAEALPWPDPVAAAQQTMAAYRRLFAS